MKLGDIFRKKYKKDPCNLTLEEINKIAVSKRFNSYKRVKNKNSIFKLNYYNIDKLFDKRLNSD
ncbi:hypothetical protein [Deferribacter desulfuricans]|uniref:hypothetical protein n=1 Tax=Deferribacter desulfuricans TaxID=197162 RepID=UPI0002D9A2EE|nr:hypothetical protein [Deferribacter desulfuricans]